MATGRTTMRGADIIAQALAENGHTTVFTLSGNHIMPLFDAAIGTGLDLVHVRHEAAAVHMADAFGRLSENVGIAWVTGGQGHTNAVAALTTAQCADAPLVLLSGHAGVGELGRGAFQELAQADIARPVTKASWTAASAADLGRDLARAIRIAKSGRPGPVHLSLPIDLLEAKLADGRSTMPSSSDFARKPAAISSKTASAIVGHLQRAKRPLVLAGPMLCTVSGRARLQNLQAATGVPAVGMESPRGINDPLLGAFAEVLAECDLVLLLGKPHDFTLRFADPPYVRADAEFIVVDPDPEMIGRVVREKGSRVILSAVADSDAAADAIAAVTRGHPIDFGWAREVGNALAYRPAEWGHVERTSQTIRSSMLCRSLQRIFDTNSDAIFVADGGEIGQWAQACVTARRRVINGVAGSIGAALPFAIAARKFEPKAPIVSVMGDGTVGFHIAEFDTAVRYNLPVVAVVGNDSRWNAEHQIQVREYGEARAHSCSLLPTRYDLVAAAFGGHGEIVTRPEDITPAVDRAIASGKPACINVMIEGQPAPIVRRAKAA